MKPFSLIVIVMLTSCVSAQGEQSLLLNIPYHRARETIIDNGWKPLARAKPDENASSHVLDLWHQGYVEVDDCSGTGRGYCIFNFQNDNGVYLRVTTQEASFGNRAARHHGDLDTIVINYGISDQIK